MKAALKRNSNGCFSSPRFNSHIPNFSVAFTIVELLVVIVVIGILAAITIVSYTGISSKATASALQSDLDNASRQLKLFQVDNMAYPTTISTDCGLYPTNTTNLCLKVSPGNSYSYVVNNSANPQVFNLTNTNTSSTTSYTISSTTSPTLGSYQTPGIVTSGLVLNLDAGNSYSYPTPYNSTSWTDLSGNNNNGTLMNGVGYNSANGGALTFDGVNDYVDFVAPNLTTSLTVEMWANAGTNFSTGKMFFGWYSYDVYCNSGLGYNTANSDVYGISSSTVGTLSLANNWVQYDFEMRSDVSYMNNSIYITQLLRLYHKFLVRNQMGIEILIMATVE